MSHSTTKSDPRTYRPAKRQEETRRLSIADYAKLLLQIMVGNLFGFEVLTGKNDANQPIRLTAMTGRQNWRARRTVSFNPFSVIIRSIQVALINGQKYVLVELSTKYGKYLNAETGVLRDALQATVNWMLKHQLLAVDFATPMYRSSRTGAAEIMPIYGFFAPINGEGQFGKFVKANVPGTITATVEVEGEESITRVVRPAYRFYQDEKQMTCLVVARGKKLFRVEGRKLADAISDAQRQFVDAARRSIGTPAINLWGTSLLKVEDGIAGLSREIEHHILVHTGANERFFVPIEDVVNGESVLIVDTTPATEGVANLCRTNLAEAPKEFFWAELGCGDQANTANVAIVKERPEALAVLAKAG